MVSSGTNIFAGTNNNLGIYLSTNNGGLWTAVNNGLTDLFITGLAISGSNIYAATQSAGVFLSTNNGGLWTAINTGLTNLNTSTIAVNGTSIFVSTGLGLYYQPIMVRVGQRLKPVWEPQPLHLLSLAEQIFLPDFRVMVYIFQTIMEAPGQP